MDCEFGPEGQPPELTEGESYDVVLASGWVDVLGWEQELSASQVRNLPPSPAISPSHPTVFRNLTLTSHDLLRRGRRHSRHANALDLPRDVLALGAVASWGQRHSVGVHVSGARAEPAPLASPRPRRLGRA